MKRSLVALIVLSIAAVSAVAQNKNKKNSDFKEVYTGTLMASNGPMRSTSFNLSIKDYTSDELAQAYLGMLVEGDQFDLLNKIKDLDLGFMSASGSLGRKLLIVRKHQLADGNTRIVAAFERWQTFGEVRGGYRVSDYPFGVIEITVNPQGKSVGIGTFIAACQVDMKKDKKTGKYQLQLENFGTFPNKVMGVMRRD
ncbi:MAG TPA: hypothetical protein VE961_06655 [Pyrinomonadaceae bacterium]|nr:hypothetical protein [Pyrinomonadaceae bacterium]